MNEPCTSTGGAQGRMQSDRPLVSIITVVYNSVGTLEQTIRSVLDQTYPYVEYILVDGGSTDGTLDIVCRYEDQIACWVSEPDDGIYDAMNKGIRLASGELIGILNSDDLYFGYTITEVVRAYEQAGELCALYGDMIKFYGEGEDGGAFFRGDMTKGAFEQADIGLNHPTCFIPKAVYVQHGLFDVCYEVGADRELMFRLYGRGVPFVHVGKTLVRFRLGGFSSSYTMRKAMRLITHKHHFLRRHDVRSSRVLSILLRDALRLFRDVLLGHILGKERMDRLKEGYLKAKSSYL